MKTKQLVIITGETCFSAHMRRLKYITWMVICQINIKEKIYYLPKCTWNALIFCNSNAFTCALVLELSSPFPALFLESLLWITSAFSFLICYLNSFGIKKQADQTHQEKHEYSLFLQIMRCVYRRPSWPGYNLTIGSSGQKVRQMQEQLNRIAQNYPAIPTITADGIYGQRTADAVKTFQRIFDLPQTGVVDYATWYEISEIYVGVSQISEPD